MVTQFVHMFAAPPLSFLYHYCKQQGIHRYVGHFCKKKPVSETGEVWATIANGITASLVSENHQILYLQSSYFAKPQSLHLRAQGIRALEKEKLEVVVDLQNKKLLKAPDDSLRLVNVFNGKDSLNIEFSLRKE